MADFSTEQPESLAAVTGAEMNYSIDKDPNRSLTLILYILYIVAIFSAGLLAVVALIINYVKRSEVRGSIFQSHFTWQIRSFWGYLWWNIIAFVPFLFLFFTDEDPDLFAGVLFGASAFCLVLVALAWFWMVYRAIRGIMRLNDNRPMYSR
jgi:uncharacterized membrane protein